MQKFLRNNKAIAWLTGVVGLLFPYIIYRQFKYGDYFQHIDWAKQLAAEGSILFRPNDMFEILVVGIRYTIPYRLPMLLDGKVKQIIEIKAYDIAATVLISLALIATALLVYLYIKRSWEASGEGITSQKAGLLTLAVLMVASIFLFSMKTSMYLGYITANPWHNPTYLLMRPFAIALFMLTIPLLYEKPKLDQILLAIFLVYMGTRSKPSFTLTFLPSLAIYGLMHWRKLKQLNWTYLIVGLGIPAVLVLASQYFLTYSAGMGNGLEFAPFRSILIYLPNIPTVLLYTLLSIASPLLFSIYYWEKIKKDPAVIIAWINFGLSLFLGYAFAEQLNPGSLNFWWNPMIALFFLFLVTVANAGKVGLLGAVKQKMNLDEWIILGAFVLQLACGVIYLIRITINPLDLL